MSKLAHILKTLLGLLFIVSAILKMVGMDQFELYVYSYHFFSLNTAFIAARIAIVLELVLGIGLLINRFHKPVWWSCVMMLLAYTGLMVYATAQGRTDNCHCFGEVVKFNPWQTIIKNVVLLALFALVYKVQERPTKHKVLVLASIVIGCFAAVFFISPPDNFFYNDDPSYEFTDHNQLEYFMQTPPLDSTGIREDKKLVGILSSSCEYCMLAAKKVSLMQEHLGFPEEDVLYVFMGTEEGVANFFVESESKPFPYVLYDDYIYLMKVTDGIFPFIVLLDNGKVIKEYDLRSMNENYIKAFFENTNEP